jgi:universal stress protein E
MTDPHGRLKRVLVASDLSSHSDKVVIGAARFAELVDAELHAVSAYQDREGMGGEMSHAVRAEVMDALPVQLRRVLGSNALQPVTTCVRFGRPDEVILERAREVDADLIVLGRHRGSDIGASFLGTTADSLLTRSTVGCLILPGASNMPFQRIGIAVDPARPESGAFDRAIGLLASVLRRDDGRKGRTPHVTVIHAVPPGTDTDAGAAAGKLEPLLDQARRIMAENGDMRLDATVITNRDPADAVTRWAWNEAADLLVVGTRDRPKVQGSHLGSVSSAVARRAECAVLMVPPDS